MTLYKLSNAKIYERISEALLEASKHCMDLLDKDVRLIWQLPTYPHLTVVA